MGLLSHSRKVTRVDLWRIALNYNRSRGLGMVVLGILGAVSPIKRAPLR
jgi:hypothetical protein